MEENFKLDPQPDPPDTVFYLTETTTFTVVTPAAAYVFDKKTGKLIKVVPEMDPGLAQNLLVLKAGADVLTATAGKKEYDEMRMQTAKMISSSAASAEKIVSKIMKPTI